MPKRGEPVDVTVTAQAGLVLLQPQTDAAWRWLKARTQATATNWLGHTPVVEPRYSNDIVDGLRADGFVCQNA